MPDLQEGDAHGQQPRYPDAQTADRIVAVHPRMHLGGETIEVRAVADR